MYRVDVTRVSSNASNDAKLSDLSVGNAGTLSPTFDKDKKSYTALVANSQSKLDSNADITSGASTFVITSDKDSAIATQGSGSVSLSAGANVITIKVTSQRT